MMRLLLIISFLMLGFSTIAQSVYSYQYLTELDSVYSAGYTIIPDSENGYYLLHSSRRDTNSNINQASIAHLDSTNSILWSEDYFIPPFGNIATNMIEINDSHFVFCGYTIDTISKAYLAKVNTIDGSLCFERSYGNAHNMQFARIIETTDSCYLVIGRTDSLSSVSLSRWDIYMAKMDTSGQIIWDMLITNNSYDPSELFAIRINKTIYISTYSYYDYYSSYGLSKGRLISISEDGVLNFSLPLNVGLYGEKPLTIVESNDGNLLISGVADNYRYPMDKSIYQGFGYGNIFIEKIDTLGNQIWQKKYFVPNLTQSNYGIEKMSDGYILCGGTGWGVFNYADSLYDFPSTSITDVYIMRIRENGDSLWMRMFRNKDGAALTNTDWMLQDIPYSMCQFTDGSIGLTGKIYPVAYINPMPPRSAWILRTDSNGCGKPGTPYGLWREELPYNNDSSIVHLTWFDDDTSNVWHHVQGSKDGQYYFWELTSRPVTNKEFFDTIPKYHNYCYRVFGLDTTWARTCESAEICITTGIQEYGPETGLLRVYPNPCSDILHCVLPDNEDYEFVVYNVLGTNAFSTSLEVTFGDDLCTIKISQLPAGIYFIEARGDKILRGKFVKE